MADSNIPDNPTAKSSKQLVEEGYNAMASIYHEWTNAYPSPRTTYLTKLLSLTPKDSPILELGCGSGIPCTKMLSEHSSNVTANDISAAMIEVAKENAKRNGVKFVHGDMMGLEFGKGSLSAVAAFYSVIHLPRDEQELMLRRIWGWLGEEGVLLLNLGTSEMVGNVNENWLGAKMYWSGFDADTNREMVSRAGFKLLEAEIIEDEEGPGKIVPFLWILAQKKGGDTDGLSETNPKAS